MHINNLCESAPTQANDAIFRRLVSTLTVLFFWYLLYVILQHFIYCLITFFIVHSTAAKNVNFDFFSYTKYLST